MIFNFIINYHVYIKYFVQERGHVNESTLELKGLVRLITSIYDHTFYLEAYKLIYIVTYTHTKKEELKVKVVELRMLRRMCGVARLDRIRDDCIKEMLSVANTVGE